MAGLMDMLGKRSETEGSASYQKTVLREIARKLADLEEQNGQNAEMLGDIRKLQKSMTQELEAWKQESEELSEESEANKSVHVDGMDDLRGQMDALIQQFTDSVDRLDERLAGVAEQVQTQQDAEAPSAFDREDLYDRLDTMRLGLEDTVHKENIKCFRNIQGALEEQGDGKDYDTKKLCKYLKVIIWFQLITIVLIVLRILGLL